MARLFDRRPRIVQPGNVHGDMLVNDLSVSTFTAAVFAPFPVQKLGVVSSAREVMKNERNNPNAVYNDYQLPNNEFKILNIANKIVAMNEIRDIRGFLS